jgi:hypothetical protein
VHGKEGGERAVGKSTNLTVVRFVDECYRGQILLLIFYQWPCHLIQELLERLEMLPGAPKTASAKIDQSDHGQKRPFLFWPRTYRAILESCSQECPNGQCENLRI